MVRHPGSRSVRTRRARAGVSLIEVLFSVGIVMIGLVGIAALLTSGGFLAHRGARADTAALMASNGSRKFSTRGMANKSAWRWFDGARWLQYNSTNGTWGWDNAGVWQPAPIPNAASSFCLDPHYITTPLVTDMATEMPLRNKFPVTPAFGDVNVMSMPRITLGSSVVSPLGLVLSEAAAKRIFVSSDDLVFDLPTDRTLGPQQNFVPEDTSREAMNRESNGHMSWMATIVPKLDRVQLAGGAGYNITDQYTLSVVVFDRRVRELFDVITGAQLIEDEIGERVVNVVNFYSGPPAFSGGDVTLESRSTRSADEGAGDLELRTGDWVMLSRWQPVMPHPILGGAISQVQVHKWYRVANVDEQLVPNSSVWQRDVTLVGPDWDYDTSAPRPSPPKRPSFAAWWRCTKRPYAWRHHRSGPTDIAWPLCGKHGGQAGGRRRAWHAAPPGKDKDRSNNPTSSADHNLRTDSCPVDQSLCDRRPNSAESFTGSGSGSGDEKWFDDTNHVTA